MSGEFDLIRRYLQNATPARDDVLLGIGDDCALLQPPAGQQLALSMDTLVCGRHFVQEVDPQALGHKSLAVNLSDLAAMGAQPAWATLALTLPEADEAWLAAFMRGFSELAARYQLQLIGGDTTRGPLSITVQVHGWLPPGKALRRGGAQAGDLVYVSGTLGDAGLALLAQQGLYVRQGALSGLRERLDWPQPRVALGLALRDHASAAIDLSDGLGGDLQHICEQSSLGALLFCDSLPVSPAVSDYIRESGDWALPLAAGDDYELAFTVPAEQQAEFEAKAKGFEIAVTQVGIMQAGRHVQAIAPNGDIIEQLASGYDHFNN